MLRLLSRGRKAQEGGEEEPKKYKKANLGQANQMYYNDELKMWVERGKEDEARAEKAKLSAPPPSVGSISAASSTTSLATMSDAAGPPAPNFTRPKSLTSRYVATPSLATAAPAAGGTPGNSPAIPGPKALLPGMGGGPKLPGVPAAPGSGPPSFFRPTPAASEATSDAMGGSEVGSVSGLSGLDASFPNSRNTSQPNFFMPGPAPSSSTTTTEDTQGAGGAMDDSVRESSGSGTVAMTERRRDPSEPAGSDVASFRESDASASGRPPALSAPSNVSFASWQQLRESGTGTGSPAAARAAAAAGSGGGGEQEVALLGQQGSSSPDTEADAQAEVSSPAPELYPSKQQHLQEHKAQAGPDSNGNAAAYGSFGVPGPAGVEPLANGNHSTLVEEQGRQVLPLDTLSAGWDSRPVKDPFDTGAEAVPAAPDSNGWGEGQQGYGWEGSGWQQQQPADPLAVQQSDPLAVAAEGGAWGVPQDGTSWGNQAWGGGWGSGDAGAAGAADPEGGSGAVAEAATDGAAAWSSEQQGPASGQQQQQADAYYGSYGQYAAAADGQQQYAAAADGQQQYAVPADSQQQYAAAADGQQQYAAAADGQQYAAAAEGTGDYGQPYGMDAGTGGYGYQPGQDGAAAYGSYYGAPAAMPDQQQQQQDAAGVLQPVHPQLPGISVAASGSGSLPSPTYAAPASGGSRGSKGVMRHTSMPGSPLAHQTSMGSLLPGPPRHSVGGLSTQRSGGLADPHQAEASAVVLSTTAAAGDPSMLTAVRPSSPYARAVSPLSRTSTGMGDAAASQASGGGFPIPSPPSHGGLLGGRVPSGSMFMPGSAGAAAPAGVPQPWQPSLEAAAAQGQPMQHQQQQEHGLMNGYDPTAHGHWAQQQQQHYGKGYGPAEQQQHLQQPQPADGAAGAGSGQPAVPPFMPGLLEALPRDAPPSWQPDGTQGTPGRQSTSASAAAADKAKQQQQQQPVAARAHPYDQFLSQALAEVNWRAVHFKQPGKLNRMLPWEEFEMEKALRQEAEAQAAGQGRTSPFWYRQMEFRQKLPPASVKPSASEPAAMPSHAVARAPPPSAAESAASQVSAYPGWPQLQEQQHQQALQQQHGLEQQHQQLVPGSPLTPAKAATTGTLGAVAAGGMQLFPEEPTPTSKLQQPAEPGAVAGPEAAAAAADGGDAAGTAAAEQQQWAGYQQAADGYWSQGEYGQYGQEQQQQYSQYYGQQYDQYGQPYPAEQQYDMSQWQQQQQPQAAEQQTYAAPGEAVGDQSGVQQEGWGTQADMAAEGTWGSPEPQQDAQQVQLDYSAAAAEDAVGAWGADEALDLQLGVVAAGEEASAVAGEAAAVLVEAAAAAPALQPGFELHPPEVVDAARAARISCSSVGLESQPSTGRVAAAAAKRIVSSALESIMQQQAELQEEQEGQDEPEPEAEAAGAGGWEGGEVAVGGWEGEADAAELELQLPEPGAAEAGAEGVEYGDAAAAPVSAAWVKLAQQFNAAADAAAAMGAADEGLLQYKEFFVQYGDYLLGALPREALQQAGLLAGEQPAVAAAAAAAAEEEEEVGKEEDEDLLAEYGNLQLRDDTSAALFASLGFDIESLIECCADA